MARPPSSMVCEAHAKGYKPALKLWWEVRKTVDCTQAQFSAAVSDKPSDTPVMRRIRTEARRILDQSPDIVCESLRIKCANVGKRIEDIYKIYIEEHPDHTISYERFRSAADRPYIPCDYRIAKAADEIIERFGGGQNEQEDC